MLCDDEFDWCDKCGERMCLACGLGSPSQLPFLYCKSCMQSLDTQDPTMNIPLLQLLVGEDHRKVLASVGYDEFVKLDKLRNKYDVVGE